MRQIFLDTETTGLDPNQGHRVIEIAAVEMSNRQLTNNHYHTYLNPERDIDSAAQEVHGITLDFLQDKPLFNDISNDFLSFIKDAEIIIHNAPFDVGFLNMELGKVSLGKLETYVSSIFDSLLLAKEIRPGQRNNLDALCKRYNVAEQKRGLHDAKSDCDLLAQVYIELIGGRQRNFKLTGENIDGDEEEFVSKKIIREKRAPLSLTQKEINEHREFIKTLGGKVLWNGKEDN